MRVIGIGPVKLADYLDQSQVVTRTSDNQVVKAEFDRWVGPFKDNFINVLADNIGSLLSTERIYLFPWRQSVPIDYQITVDVVRCDGRLGDAAWLETRWSICKGPEKSCSKLFGPVSRAGDGCGIMATWWQPKAGPWPSSARRLLPRFNKPGKAESKPASTSMVHNIIAI